MPAPLTCMASRRVQANALVFWFDLLMDAEGALLVSTGPDGGSCRGLGQAVVWLPGAVALGPGDAASVEARQGAFGLSFRVTEVLRAATGQAEQLPPIDPVWDARRGAAEAATASLVSLFVPRAVGPTVGRLEPCWKTCRARAWRSTHMQGRGSGEWRRPRPRDLVNSVSMPSLRPGSAYPFPTCNCLCVLLV